MTTAMMIVKGGLAKTAQPVREFAKRVERALQKRNERVARADAEYIDEVRRALADVEPEAMASEAEQVAV